MRRRAAAIYLCMMILCVNIFGLTLEVNAKEALSETEAVTAEDQALETHLETEKERYLAYAGFDTKAVYSIKNTLSGRYLNIPGNSSKRVKPITIWAKDGTTGQKFTFAKVSGWYTMTPKCGPSLRVNVEGEKSTSNADVGLYANTNHSTQGWYFEAVKGGYVIRSANNKNCVLDVRGTGNGAKVKIASYRSGYKGQIWQVEKLKESAPLLKKYSDITVVLQHTNSDCALASMATCELYREQYNKNGAWKDLLKNAKDPYETLKARNKGTYGNWSVIKYNRNMKISGTTSANLRKLYDEVKKGPVIVGKTWGKNGSHFSVVYKYTGNSKNIRADQFVAVDVYNGEKMSLTKWLGKVTSSQKGTWSRIIAK